MKIPQNIHQNTWIVAPLVPPMGPLMWRRPVASVFTHRRGPAREAGEEAEHLAEALALLGSGVPPGWPRVERLGAIGSCQFLESFIRYDDMM